MCFDANTSLATFSISFLSAAYLYNKNNKLDKFLAVVTILIGLMQLLEFFIWRNQQCSQINHMLSLLIIVLLTIQPILGVNYYNKLVPMNESLYTHTTEGLDDMPAHIKSSLTNNQITLSIKDGLLMLGTWQGLYLFEHRLAPQSRKIIFHYLGD